MRIKSYGMQRAQALGGSRSAVAECVAARCHEPEWGRERARIVLLNLFTSQAPIK